MIQNIKLYIKAVGVTGLLHAMRGKLTGSTVLLTVRRRDCRFPFDLRAPSTDIPTYLHIFIDGFYDFQVDTQPRVIVDAGANVGLASIYFANRYPGAKIIAIEPEKSNFELLKVNVAPYPNIVPVQAALWHENGDIDLVDPGQGKWGFMTEKKGASDPVVGTVCHSVMAKTVDRIMDDHGLGTIDILKVDIEGAEREVFRDTTAWIERVNALIVELHERMKPGCERSFRDGSSGFDNEWEQGDVVCRSKGRCLTKGVGSRFSDR